MDFTVKSTIESLLSNTLQERETRWDFHPVSGGSINLTWQLRSPSGRALFCKVHQGCEHPGLFRAESEGLKRLLLTGHFRTPEVIALEERSDLQVIVMEWIEQRDRTKRFWELFGSQLAQMHQVQGAFCGLEEDNYMGSLPQSNQPASSWPLFLAERRLEPQVKMALDKNLLDIKHVRSFERLYPQLDEIFPPEPAGLLHGDLWSGNFLCDAAGSPVLIDPAVYFGHNSMDLGMTMLFGGFDARFYESYRYHYPVASNFAEQCEICRLYPLLIHLNLFGKSYLPGILRTLAPF